MKMRQLFHAEIVRNWVLKITNHLNCACQVDANQNVTQSTEPKQKQNITSIYICRSCGPCSSPPVDHAGSPVQRKLLLTSMNSIVISGDSWRTEIRAQLLEWMPPRRMIHSEVDEKGATDVHTLLRPSSSAQYDSEKPQLTQHRFYTHSRDHCSQFVILAALI